MEVYSFSTRISNISKLDYLLKSTFGFVNSVTFHSQNIVLDIVCTRQLNTSELQLLEETIQNFDDSSVLDNHVYIPQVIPTTLIASANYETLFTWLYNGTMNENKLVEVGFHSYMSELQQDDYLSSNFTYSMKVHDISNSNILAEQTFSNAYLDYNKLYINSNLLPATNSTLQLLCKKDSETSGSNVYISSLQFAYQV